VIVLDTSVLIYAVEEHEDLDQNARDLIQAITEGRLRATTTVAVIEEFVHVRGRRWSREDAAGLGLRFIDLLSPLVASSEAALRQALRLFQRHRGIGAFDAVLAATAIEIGAEALVAADEGFASVQGLTYLPLHESGSLLG
jgi:predicted nucleic acid-binding protein